MEVSSFINLTLFWFSIAMHSFLISWIGVTVLFITASCDAARIIMLLDDCCVPFSQRKTIGSPVLITCNLICATVWHDILFISSALDPEDTWMEAAHDWIFVVKSGGLRGGQLCFRKSVPDYVARWHLEGIPCFNQDGFHLVKWNFSLHTSESTHSSPHCIDTSVWYLDHYHWAGRWWSRQILEQRVGCFCISFVLMCHPQSDCRVHQMTVSDWWQGRRRIRWRTESWILAIRLYPYNQMVRDGLSSPLVHYSGYLASNPWIGAQWWVAWSISHHIG